MKLHKNKTTDVLLKIGGTVILLVLGKKALAKARKSGSEADMDTNPASGQAVSLRQAINPSGFWWLRKVDTTDVNAIMTLAPQIKDLDDVAKHFKDQTGGADLYDELQSEVSPEDYQKFLSLASKGKTGSYYYATKSENVPVNQWVITNAKETNVRSSPVLIHYLRPDNNIVKKSIPIGMILGLSTGKYKYDEAGKVLFIEFRTITSKGINKTYYVAKSQIEFVTPEEKKKREKTSKIPLQVIEGFSNVDIEATQEVVTTDICPVYDEKFNQVGLANKNTILGYPQMTLDTKKGKYIKLKTIQGLVRWVKADLAVIRDKDS